MIHAERVLLSLLDDVEALERIARSGFDPAVMPTQPLRRIVTWALEEFHRTKCLQAPSREALMASWTQSLEDAEYELIEEGYEADSIDWAMEWLNSNYLHAQWQALVKKSAPAVAKAAPSERVELVQDFVSDFVQLSFQVGDQTHQVTVGEGMRRIMQTYERRKAGTGGVGLKLGYEEIDQHTGGVQDGELAIMAAGPKQGKSYQLARSALTEFEAGACVALYTLENSVDMTMERVICMAANVDYRRWQRGQATEDEELRVQLYWDERIKGNEDRFNIIHPLPGESTPAAMVKRAHVLGADRLYIDQLTFIEHPNPARKPRHEIIRDILHELKSLISAGSSPLPCLLAHQINREGVKKAEQSDSLEMWMMAESSEVERTADWVFGLYASQMERIGGMAKLQILASRRETLKNWRITWRPGVRESVVRSEFTATGAS